MEKSKKGTLKEPKSERPRWASFSFLSAVESFILSPDGAEVLLLKRGSRKKVLPNYYAGVGGKMDRASVESPMDAAERETLEESGYSPKDMRDPLKLKSVFTVFDKFGRWMVFGFSGRVRKKKFLGKKTITEGTLEWVKITNLRKKRLILDLSNGLLEKIIASTKILFVTVTYGKNDRVISLKTRRG